MQSIGERLEEARKRKGVTIREASEATKIRGDYLASFENNNFSINVPDIYVRGFLRSYSNFLKLNSEKLITDLNATLIGEAKSAKREHREFFGRMELQQPLVQDPKKPNVVDDDEHRAAESETGPTGFLANIDREVLIKGGIVAVIAVLCIVGIIFAVRFALSDPATPAANTPAAVSPGSNAQTQTITLKALGDVRVSVTEINSGRTLLSLQAMAAGQTLDVTKSGPIRLEYSNGENLHVIVNGQEMRTGKVGEGASRIP